MTSQKTASVSGRRNGVSALRPTEVFSVLRSDRVKHGAPDVKTRIRRLKALRQAVLDSRVAIQDAMASDFGKPAAETDLSEILPVLVELKEALAGIRSWTRPRRVSTPLVLWGTRTHLHYQPRGVVLILAPWNYPVNLTLGPLVAAIAAGNHVVVKPSEFAPSAAVAVRAIIERVFEPSACVLIEGDHTVAEQLTELPFDHIFFTGSPEVGRRVMTAAARNHTSVTLELGGKSPAIIDGSAGLARAAKTIAFGKFSNGGQTCIAPDYVLVQSDVHDTFLELLVRAVEHMFPVSEPEGAPSSAGIITEEQCRLLRTMLDEAIEQGASLVLGGRSDAERREFEPTIIKDVPAEARLMQEEIFGPILPIVRVESLSEAVEIVASKPPPLTLYIYSKSKKVDRYLLERSRAGSTVINDTLIQWVHTRAPFGGIGSSGFGRSHGFAGFKEFSNERAVVRQVAPWPPIHLLYPPFGRLSNRFREWVIAYLRR
jgi:aldehyde dehydrogenase (NAD+)